MMSIETNLRILRTQIERGEIKYHRVPHSVILLAASKGQSIEKITAAFLAGQHAFGENYLQEALPKIAALKDKAIEWHFIGPIQRNKTRKIAEQFSWVHSVDSELIANRLNEQRPCDLPPLNICIEVNISAEPTKSGVPIDQVESLARHCLTLPHLHFRGLMALPAIKCDFIEQREEFRKLRIIAELLAKKGFPLDTLSMGTSHDLDAAIAEQATIVRIGTKIFSSNA